MKAEAEIVANEILNDEPYKHSLAYKCLATEYLKLKKIIDSLDKEEK